MAHDVPPRVAVLLGFVVLASACGTTTRHRAAPPAAVATSTPSATDAPASSTPSSTPTTSSSTSITGRRPTATTTTTTTVTAPPGLERAGDAGEAIVVTAHGAGATTARLAAYERQGDGWRVVTGPIAARVGARGVAPPGAKREGDGRTPAGTFGFDFAFGRAEDPGTRLPYRRITPSIVWDDDPASPRYNTWVDSSAADAGARPEPMDVAAYDLGAVIAYNTARAPGAGSAIFLHITTGRATAGCVALAADELRRLVLWLDPARAPVIVIRVA